MRYLLFYAVMAADACTVGDVSADTNYGECQLERLLQPTEQDLALEDAARVYIYDGLKDSGIEYAMEAQFDRVANMMFVRTIATDDSGTSARLTDR